MNPQPKNFIIEGVDRMGKSTLIQGIQNARGYHLVIHYDKPKKLDAYGGDLQQYQHMLYHKMFYLVHNQDGLIFDRGHLGEVVYAPLYRKYSGEYVFGMERAADTRGTRLILLTTSDFSFIQDDGLSLDFSKKEEEQAKFVAAFHASTIKDKVIIDVCDGRGGYKDPATVLVEALKNSLQDQSTHV